LGNQKLQLACLVTAKGKAGLVIALDQDFRATEHCAKTRQFLDGRGQMGKDFPGWLHCQCEHSVR